MMKKFMIVLLVIFAVIAVLLIANGIYCDNNIKVTDYEVENTKNDAKLRFVIVSDLHNKEFGEQNKDLIETVKEQNPDFIAVCGDMIVRKNSNTEIMKTALKGLCKIAPVYCCLGNHERDMTDEIDFESEINSTGAVLLDNELVRLKRDGQDVLIGGLTDFPYYDFNAPDYDTPERYFWDKFSNESQSCFSILLHHQPEYIAETARGGNIDVIACGHTHGGQVQIPFVGGLIAPNQGLFPKYDKGVYDLDGVKMIVSTGLGNNVPFPRINNQAEICTIDIK